jgi:hypothetical protein
MAHLLPVLLTTLVRLAVFAWILPSRTPGVQEFLRRVNAPASSG